MKKDRTLLLLAIVLSCITFIGAAFAAGGPRAVTVDAGKMIGHIRSLQGSHYNPGPVGEALSNSYVAIGVDAIRTHDAGRGGIGGVGNIDSAVLPGAMFPDLSKDPNDPASYNFGPTDALIKNIRDIGAEVYFRVGRSAMGGLADNYVPPDMDKYSEIVKHVVMHYNKGWANGFHYGIKYWEIWNEPDIFPFWAAIADPSQYHQLYKKLSLAIKSVDRHAKVGGPANTTNNDFTGLEESFLQFIVDNRLPMDFYSFHHYDDHAVDPFHNVVLAQKFRDLLDAYGFNRAEVVNSEYGSNVAPTPLIPGIDIARAIFTGETQIYLQDAPIDQVYAYMLTTAPPNKENNAFGMVSTLNRTPQRLWTSGGDNTGFAVLAGRDNGRRELRVLIANYEISPLNMGEPILDMFGNPLPNNIEAVFIPGLGPIGTWVWPERRTITYQDTEGYNLEIKDIPLGWGDLTVEQYRIDLNNNMTLVDSWTINKEDRKDRKCRDRDDNRSITVSGAWTHAAPNPPADPVGVAQGMDMIVVYGSSGR